MSLLLLFRPRGGGVVPPVTEERRPGGYLPIYEEKPRKKKARKLPAEKAKVVAEAREEIKALEIPYSILKAVLPDVQTLPTVEILQVLQLLEVELERIAREQALAEANAEAVRRHIETELYLQRLRGRLAELEAIERAREQEEEDELYLLALFVHEHIH